MPNDALIEQGVEVLRRLTVSNKLSLGDVSFIAGWVNDARTELRRAATSSAGDLVARLEAGADWLSGNGLYGEDDRYVRLLREAAQALRYQSTGVTGEELTRPIIGIENRTAQEVFDIMCDRFRRDAARQSAGVTEAQAQRALSAVDAIVAEGTSDNPLGYGPPYKAPWHIIDRRTAEPEVNWPGELIETVNEAGAVHVALRRARVSALTAALSAQEADGDQPS